MQQQSHRGPKVSLLQTVPKSVFCAPAFACAAPSPSLQ